MPEPQVITIIEGHLRVGLSQEALNDEQCQVTSAAVNASPNLVTVPATFCAPQSQRAARTSWELAVTALQDWEDPDGFSWWAKDHDTEEIFWELALTDDDDAIMHGKATVTALPFGGDAGTPLTGSATWPCTGEPEKGPWTAPTAATTATAGTPGTYTPAGATPPDRLADMAGVTASPTAAWGEGEYVVTDMGEEVHWDGVAWAAGRAPAP
jgi:hypothetical protein